MKVVTDPAKIDEVLTRAVEDVFIKEDLRTKLQSGKQLRIKLGIDPTSPFIHLGRAVTLRKLKAFQDLGHHIVFIVGDYTAKIGDPSDKLEKRPMLTDEAIKTNLTNYLEQVALILDMKDVEVRYNSEWLKSMTFFEISQLLECFTVQQMTKRRNFKDRLDAGVDIFMVEFLYPALQGYDSVMVKADVEIGGFDQLFNLMAGRTVQKRYDQPEQDVMVLSMLDGTDGRKMSSSWGNIISVIDTPFDMFSKVMAVNDDLIIKYFTLCTETPMPEIESIEKELKTGINPRDAKIKLAHEITKIYHGEVKSNAAEVDFINAFQKGGIPEEMEEVLSQDTLMASLVKGGIVSSNSEFRRLVEEGGITNLDTNEKLSDFGVSVSAGSRFRIGKKRFIKII